MTGVCCMFGVFLYQNAGLAYGLKNQLQPELDLPWCGCGRGDQPGRRADCGAGEYRGVGRPVIVAIQDVEKFRAELQRSVLGNAGVLENREIKIRETGAVEIAATGVSISTRRRKDERARIE